jgi:Ca-activated chloride channel family protein
MEAVPRDLIVLLDTSGSMSGEPLDQARRVVNAMIDTLGERDRLEIIEFSNQPRRWKSGAKEATESHKAAARTWLAGLRAGGGTEMASGMIEALQPLRWDAQRQVVLITDGLIGAEHEVLKTILKKLPAGSRVHCVGVGSGVNRSLTMPAARAGRGVELIIGIGEDAEVAAKRLLARTTAPLVTEVEVSGSAVLEVAPEHPMDLFGGAPTMLCFKLNPAGGELVVRGKTAEGNYLERMTVSPVERGEGSAAIAKLFARECVEDLETKASIGENRAQLDRQVEQLGLAFQISTRLTSWVAVSQHQTVDPTAARKHVKVPQNLPHGMSAEGLGLRQAEPYPAMAPAPAGAMLNRMRSKASAVTLGRASHDGAAGRPPPAKRPAPMMERPRAPELDESAADMEMEEGEPEPEAREEAPRRESRTGGMRPPPAPIAEAPAEAPKDKSVSLEKKARKEAEPEQPRTFSARLVLLKDGRLAVEFTFEGEPMSWAPINVTVELADGSVISAQVDPRRTTTPHAMQSGSTITLALQVPAGIAQPVKVNLTSGTTPVQLEL